MPNLPCLDLLTGPREDYIKIALPLHKASVKGDWKTAKMILDKTPELVRYSITENGDTALHVATSASRSKQVDRFVEHLVDFMGKEDLALQNKDHNTALYLAATAGNIETVRIIVKKNKDLLSIPGGAGGQLMPLYAAAFFGKYEVVKYMYDNSSELRDDGWIPVNRGSLLEKCVENDIFDVAIQILKKDPDLASSGSLLGVLAHKPNATFETKTNIIEGTIKSVFSIFGLKARVLEKESDALLLLRIIWKDIAKRPKTEIDSILRGPPDSKLDNKSASEFVVQAIQLQKLITEYCHGMHVKTKNIIQSQPRSSVKQDTHPASGNLDQAQQLENLISEHLVNLHLETQNIIKQDNKPVSGKGDQLVLQLQKLIYKHVANMHQKTQMIIKITRKEVKAVQLRKLIVENIENVQKETRLIIGGLAAKERHSSRVQFIAAEMGNTKFLIELIRLYPDLIWKVNDENQSIFHIAAKYRHAGIYSLLYEIGAMKDLITPLKDQHDNNMLHLVGMTVNTKGLEDESITALHMQRELLWFEEVESMIPPSYRERRNSDGLTPRELFRNEHKDMVTQAERWMKEIATQCIVVGALVATMVFAAAFTVPGGYDQNGIPIFHSKTTFKVFVVADGISLFLSSASVLYMFLSLSTSHYTQRDFLEILPRKLMVGLSFLLLSITTMIIAIAVNFFVLYQKNLLWMPILISGFALIPFAIYVKAQYGLILDLIRLRYHSAYLFKPQKHVLYYENPMF